MNDAKVMRPLSPTIFSGEAGQHRLLPTLLAAMVLVISLCATGATWWHAKQQNQQEQQAEFLLHAEEISARIKLRMDHYQQVLRSVHGFYAASQNVTEQELRRFVASLQIEQLYPGIQDIGIAMKVPPAKKQQHISTMRKRGFPEYRIWPEGKRDLYTAITQFTLHPERNRAIVGLDMFADPARRRAMEQARDSGDISVSSKVKLILADHPDRQAGFLMYLPIYSANMQHGTPEQRRAHLVGWVYTPFLMADLIANLRGKSTSGLELKIFDGSTPSDNALMFASKALDVSRQPDQPVFSDERQLMIADRPWILTIRSQPAPSHSSWSTPKVFASAGIALSILLSLLTWALASSRAKALATASRLTKNLRESETRFRKMANNAPAMIWITNASLDQLWANSGYIEFSGYTTNIISRELWRQRIHPEDLPQLIAQAQESIQTKITFINEHRARHHNGQYRWILCTGVPSYDEQDEFTGFIGTGIDITERKHMEEQLQLSSLVYQHSSEAMMIADILPDMDIAAIASLNPAACQTTGYTLQDVIGKDARVLASTHHDQSFVDIAWETAKTRGQWQGEGWIGRKDGSAYQAWLNLNVARDENGHANRLLVLSRDITAQKEAEETIRSLTSKLISAREEEARRIARDIHDDLGQQLALMRLRLSLIPHNAKACTPTDGLACTLEHMKASIDDCMHKVRNIASNLRPATLDMGLGLAIESLVNDFCAKANIKCRLTTDLHAATMLDDSLATNAYRILQEALSNVIQHASASQIVVSAQTLSGHLVIEIVDNGIGFDTTKPGRSHGLAGMRERATMLGGSILITSASQRGTSVRASFPLKQAFSKADS